MWNVCACLSSATRSCSRASLAASSVFNSTTQDLRATPIASSSCGTMASNPKGHDDRYPERTKLQAAWWYTLYAVRCTVYLVRYILCVETLSSASASTARSRRSSVLMVTSWFFSNEISERYSSSSRIIFPASPTPAMSRSTSSTSSCSAVAGSGASFSTCVRTRCEEARREAGASGTDLVQR